MKWLLVIGVALGLGACAPNAPCLNGHNSTWYSNVPQCVSYGKYGCNSTIYIPQQNTQWVCDNYGTPYPSGDPRR